MKDIKGFCRLFDLNIPYYGEFEYYIDQLSKTEKHKNIKDLIRIYEEDEKKYGDLFQLRVQKSRELIDFLAISHAYTELTYDNIESLPTNKEFIPEEGKKYISIDLKQANWQSLKKYDKFNDLGDSYENFLRNKGFPETLIKSKFLRQFIYGNLNPKKQQKIQRKMMEEVINIVGNHFKIECIKNDEVIFSYDIVNELILDKINKERFHIKFFTVKFVEDFKIYSYANHIGEYLYKELNGCDGLKYFMRLKQYIIEESLDIRDLYFHVNGETAIWKTNELKVSLNGSV